MRSEDKLKQELEQTPPQRVEWYQMDRVAEFAPELDLRKWQEIKQTAREHLEIGKRACDAMAMHTPWERAQFLAIRYSMIEQWQPRGGIEQALVDQMAQSYAGWLTWLQDFHHLQRLSLPGAFFPMAKSFRMVLRTRSCASSGRPLGV